MQHTPCSLERPKELLLQLVRQAHGRRRRRFLVRRGGGYRCRILVLAVLVSVSAGRVLVAGAAPAGVVVAGVGAEADRRLGDDVTILALRRRKALVGNVAGALKRKPS